MNMNDDEFCCKTDCEFLKPGEVTFQMPGCSGEGSYFTKFAYKCTYFNCDIDPSTLISHKNCLIAVMRVLNPKEQYGADSAG